MSPAFLSGIKNSLAESALELYLSDNAATSISIFYKTFFGVSRGDGAFSCMIFYLVSPCIY